VFIASSDSAFTSGLLLAVLVEDRSDAVDHLVWERWQFINLRIQGGMFVRSSGKGPARMHVSWFDVLVT
jgi:hypothetical protein